MMNYRNVFIGVVSIQLLVLLVLSFYKEDNQIAYLQLGQINKQLHTEAALVRSANDDLERALENFDDVPFEKSANHTLENCLRKHRKLFWEIDKKRAKITNSIFSVLEEEENNELIHSSISKLSSNRLVRQNVTFQDVQALCDAWERLKKSRLELLNDHFLNQQDRDLIHEYWSKALNKSVFIKKMDNENDLYKMMKSFDAQNALVFLSSLKLELALLAYENTTAFYEINQQMVYPFDKKEFKISYSVERKEIKKNEPFHFYLDIITVFRDPDIKMKINNQSLKMDNGIGIYDEKNNYAGKNLNAEAIFSNSYNNQIDTVSGGFYY